jgi:hypothetical protein
MSRKGWILIEQLFKERRFFDTMIKKLEVYVEEIPENAIRLQGQTDIQNTIDILSNLPESFDIIIIPRN